MVKKNSRVEKGIFSLLSHFKCWFQICIHAPVLGIALAGATFPYICLEIAYITKIACFLTKSRRTGCTALEFWRENLCVCRHEPARAANQNKIGCNLCIALHISMRALRLFHMGPGPWIRVSNYPEGGQARTALGIRHLR